MAKALRPPRWFDVPLAWLVLSCGGDSEPSDTTRNLSIQGGDNQSAAAGAAVTTPPSVKVGNSSGAGVSGVSVTFAVGSGGGTVTGGTQTTNAQGIATVGGWTLGQATGPNTLLVTVPGSSSTVTVNATATAGPAATLAKTAGDNQNATVKTAVATKPAVRVNDQFGNPVAGAAVAFTVTAGGGTVTGAAQTTDAQGIATVGGWALGPTNGANRLSAAVQGVAAIQPQVFTATGAEVVIQPAADTVFQAGTISLTRLVIPAGRTVTAAGNVIINADSTVEIAGTLQGNCVSITLNGEQDVTVTGVIDNVCPGGSATPPAIRLVAKGGYTLEGPGAIRSSGGGEITNDPTLTDADFPATSPAFAAPRAAGVTRAVNKCRVAMSFPAVPDHAPDGLNAKHGTNGENASNGWTLRCRGNDLDLGTGTQVFGPNGGNGGEGEDLNGDPGDALGGDGGRGGDIKLQSTGRVIFSGSTLVGSGHGGNGGNAAAKGKASKAGSQEAAGAKAKGGSGGAPGSITVVGAQGVVGAGNLTLNLGHAGEGGEATATGADGVQGESPSSREQDGGFADAEGGAGGTTPEKQATASGNTNGNPIVNGGQGGRGGKATASAGNGAAGTADKPDGGNGGSNKAVGGKGGDALAKDFAPPAGTGQRFADAGDGGFAKFQRALGADGWDNCIDFIRLAGKGGNGGSASGASGLGGTGGANGDPGGVIYETTGNGAIGGDHFVTPGGEGSAGASTVTENGPVTGKDTSFKPGQPGKLCPGLFTLSVIEMIFKHIGLVTSCPQNVGTSLVTNTSNVPITITTQVLGTNVLEVLGGGVVVPPGGTAALTVRFNCSQAFSFHGQVRVTGTPQGGGNPQQTNIEVTGNLVIRAVRLAQAFGSFAANALIQQNRVTNWLFGSAHTPNCAVNHLHSTSMAGIFIDGLGPFADPNPTACGYGEVVEVALPMAP